MPMSDVEIEHRNRAVKLKHHAPILQFSKSARIKMNADSVERHICEAIDGKATFHPVDREVAVGFMTGDSLDVVDCHAVHLASIDPHVRKREVNWYVKVEERQS